VGEIVNESGGYRPGIDEDEFVEKEWKGEGKFGLVVQT
jgi:hypothetical protein